MSGQFRFAAGGYWSSRLESPDALARRFLAFLASLSAINPEYADWWFSSHGVRPVPDDASELAHFISEKMSEIDIDGIGPAYGYSFLARNTEGDGVPLVGMELRLVGGATKFWNFIALSSDVSCDPDESLYTFPVLRGITLALAQAFQADRAQAYPENLSELWVQDHRRGPFCFEPSWVSYAGPRFAPLVRPVPSAIIEHTAEGGLLLSVTKDPFDIMNPRHVAISQEIAAAGDAFRYVQNQDLTRADLRPA